MQKMEKDDCIVVVHAVVGDIDIVLLQNTFCTQSIGASRLESLELILLQIQFYMCHIIRTRMSYVR